MASFLQGQHLRNVPASGYFPVRLIEFEIKDGRLHLINYAPRFAYAAYPFSVSRNRATTSQSGEIATVFRTKS